MARYINPGNDFESNEKGKVSIAAEIGIPAGAFYPGVIDKIPKWADLPADTSMLVLIDNGPFKALAIVDNERDFEGFTQPSDRRTRAFYHVPNTKLSERGLV